MVGGGAAVANVSSRFLFSHFVPYAAAVTLAFFVGVIVGFIFMRAFVFIGGTSAPAKQASYFLLVNLVGLAITLIVSIVVSRGLTQFTGNPELSEAVGHLSGVAAPVLMSFYAHKNLTFRRDHE